MKKFLIAMAALVVTSGCTHTVTANRFEPASSVRSQGSVTIGAVRYIPAERKALDPRAFEFNKGGRVLLDTPLADQFRRGVVRELEASGFRVGPGGVALDIDITRWHLADKFTSLELYVESAWTLRAGDRTVSRQVRAARRHFSYTEKKKAEDVNAEITESYEKVFSDPEVLALFTAGSAR